MTGFLFKRLSCPVVLYLAHRLLPGINFATLFQVFIVGLVLSATIHLMEVLMLKRGTLWKNTVLDLGITTGIIYLSQFFLPGATVSAGGAFTAGIILTVSEYFLHRYLIASGKVQN